MVNSTDPDQLASSEGISGFSRTRVNNTRKKKNKPMNTLLREIILTQKYLPPFSKEATLKKRI